MEEDKKFTSLNEKYENDMKELREQMKLSDQKHDEQLGKIISLIQENSKLAKVKTNDLSKSITQNRNLVDKLMNK